MVVCKVKVGQWGLKYVVKAVGKLKVFSNASIMI